MSEQLISTPGEFGENGNFLLERELGAGGMGGVYMGRDKMLDRPVAVKVRLRPVSFCRLQTSRRRRLSPRRPESCELLRKRT